MRPYKYATGPGTRITFPSKPDERVRACLRAHGFQWSPSMGCWWKRGFIGLADIVAAPISEGDPGAGKYKRAGFIMGTVFDVSQTEPALDGPELHGRAADACAASGQ